MGNEKQFSQVYGIPPAGQFALDAKPPKTLHWDNCREQFANKFKKDTAGFFFSHYSSIGLDIAAFVNTTEKILNLSDFSTFRLTKNSTVSWVAPNNFWKTCKIRRSLFTILLRSGLEFSQEG
jgi:hypothetical protein